MPYQNGQQQQYAPQDQYDFDGGAEDGGYVGSVPRGNFAPAQTQIPAFRAVPPKDPRTGRYVQNNQQLRQPVQRHPLQMSQREREQQYQQQQQQFDQQPQLDSEAAYDPNYGQPSQQSQPEQVFEHPRALLRRAYEVGFSDQEIDAMPSEALDEAVWGRHRAGMEESRQRGVAQALQPVQQQQPLQQQQQAPQQEETPPIDFGEFETVMDQGFVKNLKKHLTDQLKQFKTLEKKLVEQEARNQQREQAEAFQRKQVDFANYMDRLFTPFAEFLGDERWNELQAGDANYAKRKAVMSIIETDQTRRTMPEKVAFAVSQLFLGGRPLRTRRQAPQQQQQAFLPQHQQNMTQRQVEWQQAALQRPTQRRPAAEVNGVRKAIQSVTEQLQQVSQEAGGNGMPEYDDFLGGEPYQTYQ